MKGGLSLICFFFLKTKSVIVPYLEQGERTHETSNSFSQFEYVCASSPGGPGLNFGELNAGRSILGTIASNQVSLWSFLQRPFNPNTHTIMDSRLSRAISSKNKSHQKGKKKSKSYNSPINPSPGVSVSGSPISAFTPHTIVVSPILTSAEPWAVDIEPVLILTCLHTSSAAEAEALG